MLIPALPPDKAGEPESALLAPQTPIRLPVPLRVPGRTAAAVGRGGDVDRSDITTGGLPGEGAVEFVDDLPALLGQRFRHRRGLVRLAVGAREGGGIPVTGTDVVRGAARLLAAGTQRGGGIGEVE